MALATEQRILEFIDIVSESKEQQRLHMRAALRLAGWPGPKWQMRWERYQMARSSKERLTALWAEVSAPAAVRLAEAAREAGATIVVPEDFWNGTLYFIDVCRACCHETMQAKDLEMAAALAQAVDAAVAEIAHRVQGFLS